MRHLAALHRRLARFGRDEEGSMVIFAMFLMLVMLMVGGMAVDVMRFETNRTRLQATLDRAVLASADLDQTRNPRAVVEDFFDKEGLLDELTSITVTETINSRRVAATAELGVNTLFMDMLGVPTLAAPASGAAEESVNDIEIILVLDVSGSMAANSKMTNLQAAARDFVSTVLANDTENRMSIGIVPFNGQVNLGTDLRPKYTISDVVTSPTGVNCVDLPTSVYGTQTISRTTSMPATQHADTFSTTNRANAYYAFNDANYGVVQLTNVWCPPTTSGTTGNVVTLPMRSISGLHTRINALSAVGATSINAGMRWGMTLLDPAARPMFSEFVSAGRIPSYFSGRPYNYDRDDTLKVIVLMTDGEHFAEERVNTGYRGATISDIWRATDSNAYFSIYHASQVNRTGTGATLAANIAASRPFWVPHLSQWHARPWNGTSPVTSMPYAEGTLRRFDVNGNGTCDNTDDGRGTLKSNEACWGKSTQQTWGQVWTATRMHWVAWQLYGRPLSTTASGRAAIADTWMYNFRAQTATGTMDTQLQQMCSRARTSDVVVFGIAFEAPANGQTQIFNCASTPSQYFNAQGLQITTAFRAIASQINALRLVQ